jgi:hypothetical protein
MSRNILHFSLNKYRRKVFFFFGVIIIMKIYTRVDERKSGLESASYVGTVLVGDQDQIYFKDGFKLTVQDKVSAHLYGLKRCISFIKNVKPLHCNDMIHFVHDNVRVDIDRELNDRIACDEYVQKFIKEKGISIKAQNKDFSDFDKQMLMIAGLEISPRIFNKGYSYDR